METLLRSRPLAEENRPAPLSESPQRRRPSTADARGPEDPQSRTRRQGRRLAFYHAQPADDGVHRQSPRLSVTALPPDFLWKAVRQ